jgi:hypothetical protein
MDGTCVDHFVRSIGLARRDRWITCPGHAIIVLSNHIYDNYVLANTNSPQTKYFLYYIFQHITPYPTNRHDACYLTLSKHTWYLMPFVQTLPCVDRNRRIGLSKKYHHRRARQFEKTCPIRYPDHKLLLVLRPSSFGKKAGIFLCNPTTEPGNKKA